jgi:hypothetical protein
VAEIEVDRRLTRELLADIESLIIYETQPCLQCSEHAVAWKTYPTGNEGDADNDNAAADRVFIRQRKIRFADLGEVFLARLRLSLVTDPLEERTLTVSLDLAFLFPSRTLEDVLTRTSDLE